VSQRPDEAAPEEHRAAPPGGPTPPPSSLVERARARVEAQVAWGQELLEQHRGRGPVDVALRVYRRDREMAGTLVGSAVAFRLFLFFVPMLLFVVGFAGFFRELVEPDDLDNAGITGTIATQIESALDQPGSTRWLAIGFGLFGMISAGRTLSKVTVAASCLAWRLPVRAKASVRFIGAMVGLMVGIALVTTMINYIRHHLGIGAAGVSFFVGLAVYGLAWLILSALVPRPSSDPGALLPGALIVGTTIVSMQAVSQLYLPGRFASASELYGAIGVTIVTLGWFFIVGRAMVLAFVVDAVVYERYGSISQLVFSLPLLRRLPQRSAWLRRTFDLEEGDEQ
jgi:uncharacterized BrkB/YihY/UPF0761 family membrane protein